MPLLSALYLHTNSKEEAQPSSTTEQQQWTFGALNQNVFEEHVSFINVTFISEYKNDSNTQTFEMNKNTFIDKESSNNYEMFNTKYQEIRMQSIVFVTLRIPNNKTEVLLRNK